MITVLLVIHIMIAAALIAVVLLQRSEGGALGIGGGGGFMTGRSAGNAMFFATSLGLTMIAGHQSAPTSIFGEGTSGAPAQGGGGSLPGLVLPSAPPAPSGAPAPQAPQPLQSP